jgi:hypothetical protein
MYFKGTQTVRVDFFVYIKSCQYLMLYTNKMGGSTLNSFGIPGWKKIKQRRISLVLGYLRMILWKNSTAIYLYGFWNQSLGLILGNILKKN